MGTNRSTGVVQLGIEMTPEQREALRARASAEDRTIKAVILRAINLYLSTPLEGGAIPAAEPAPQEKPAKRKVKK
jgi:hypothetical protein